MDIVNEMRGFEIDHSPDGWPGVRMRQVSALCDEIERLRTELAHVGAADEVMEKDAERYRWLRSRLLGADFDWNDSGTLAVVFEWPQNSPISANCDMSIDEAMAQTHNGAGEQGRDHD